MYEFCFSSTGRVKITVAESLVLVTIGLMQKKE